MQEKAPMAKSQKSETKPDESCQSTPPAAEEGNADVGTTSTTRGKRGRIQRRSRRQHTGQPPEGSNTKKTRSASVEIENIMTVCCDIMFLIESFDSHMRVTSLMSLLLYSQLKASLKMSEGQDRSTATVQKRPMRPILPAYCSTAGKTYKVQAIFFV